MKIIIEIAKECNLWQVNKSLLKKVIANIINRFPNLSKIKSIEISLLLTNNEKMQSLNLDLRKMNKPTNVLSMPDIELSWQSLLEYKFNLDYTFLGDIAFGYETILQEANSRGISFNDHFIHLYVHGILHMLGYDHIKDFDANVMEDLEISILKFFNIKSPYITII